jgi:hypothetical protein
MLHLQSDGERKIFLGPEDTRVAQVSGEQNREQSGEKENPAQNP